MKIIDLNPDGESTALVDLGTALVSFVTRYNYSAQCWTLDLVDIDDVAILQGLMLVPDIDLLKPYTEVKEDFGALVLVEKSVGDYQDPDGLGIKTKILWYEPGEEIVLPI